MFSAIMHPSLALLIRLQMRAKRRRFLRNLKTPKGLVFTLLAFVLIAFWMGPAVFIGFAAKTKHPETVRSTVPFFLLAFCAVQLFSVKPDRGIIFQPAEVDFLFSGPFRRRELLIYKIVGVVIASFGVSVFPLVMLLAQIPNAIYGYVGLVLALLFGQLFGMTVTLLAANVAVRAFNRTRRLVLIAVALVAGMAVLNSTPADDDGGIMSRLKGFEESKMGAAILAPFDVFGRVMAAEAFYPEMTKWGAAALGLNLLLVLIILRLDANFLEASVETSRKFYERVQRMRRGAPMATSSRFRLRWRVPVFGWWTGAGPNAWRQTVNAVRGAGRTLFVFAIMGAIFLFPAFSGQTFSGEMFLPVMLPPLAGMALFVLPQMVTFDFRGDADRIEALKALPISAAATVVGQVAVPVVFATLLESAIVAATPFIRPEVWKYAVAVIVFLLPVNALLFELENLMFLLFPHRLTVGAADFSTFGRRALQMFIKMLVLMLACGIAGGLGAAAFFITNQSLVPAIATAWLAATGLAIALLPALVLAYKRFDPSHESME